MDFKLEKINNTYGTFEFKCPCCNQNIGLTRNYRNENLGIFQCGKCNSVLSAKLVKGDLIINVVNKFDKKGEN